MGLEFFYLRHQTHAYSKLKFQLGNAFFFYIYYSSKNLILLILCKQVFCLCLIFLSYFNPFCETKNIDNRVTYCWVILSIVPCSGRYYHVVHLSHTSCLAHVIYDLQFEVLACVHYIDSKKPATYLSSH